MTGEEIINNLLYMKRYVKEDTTEDSTIDEAIKALEQQSCEEGERMKDYNLINQRATTCRHGGHCEWVACDKCNHYEPDGLNQQPCEDAISRKAVLNKLNKLIEVERLQGTDEMGYGRERVSAYESMIFEIENKYLYPSVNPQQPCDDCISRQAVLDINEHHHGQMPNHVNHEIWNEINALPSVTPKEKTGHWEYVQYDGNPNIGNLHCSECDRIAGFEYNFCPNCGAKMIEPTGK